MTRPSRQPGRLGVTVRAGVSRHRDPTRRPSAPGATPGATSGASPVATGEVDKGAGRRVLGMAGRVAVGIGVPLLIYYLLRAAGASVYVALLVSTLVSAIPSLVQLLRRQRVNALSAYFTTMLLGSVLVSAIAGSTQFLLAKEAVLTGVTGLWFLASAFGQRPLSYVFTRPLLEGRLHWPEDWDGLWLRCPRWRLMWRISSGLWACGTLADAVLRVVFAYTLPPDSVPALATGLVVVTSVVLVVITNAVYIAFGVFNPGSALYRSDSASDVDAR